jgi:hypothetical protein
MTLTATHPPTTTRRTSLEPFRALNQARVPSTDPRRLAMARNLFPTTRRGARLDDDRAVMRLLTAVIVTP